MKYAIICCSDGNYTIHSEHPTPEAAKVEYHRYAAALWNDASTTKATIKIVDEQLDAVEGYMELVIHPQEETNEPE